MERRVKQLSINAEELDRRASMARRLNRNHENRLRKQYAQFRDKRDAVTEEIDQEIKRIQHDLGDIREMTGYEENADHGGPVGKRKRRPKHSHVISPTKTSDLAKSRRRLARVYNGDTGTQSESKEKDAEEKKMPKVRIATAPSVHNASTQRTGARRLSRSGLNKAKDGKLPQLTTNSLNDSSSSLLELDSVSEAREQAMRRLVGGQECQEEQQPTEDEGEEGASADDIESYMYVPPDGRKRTVYLIPPLEDLLKEARKARYLRIPKRLLGDDQEDLDTELSIDEIFGKTS